MVGTSSPALLLIGLSLISGLLVRASAPFGILIMMTYWTAHMDFPYIENINSFIIDYHPVYALVLGLLILRRAGHVCGLDGVVANWTLVQHNTGLRWLTGVCWHRLSRPTRRSCCNPPR